MIFGPETTLRGRPNRKNPDQPSLSARTQETDCPLVGFEFRLRRWPAEADTPITAGLEPGEPVPGEPAFRTTPGKALAIVKATLEIAGQKMEKSVAPGAKDVVFNLALNPGPATLTARLTAGDGQVYGAYYVSVKRRCIRFPREPRSEKLNYRSAFPLIRSGLIRSRRQGDHNVRDC